jgi:hypothetical protein
VRAKGWENYDWQGSESTSPITTYLNWRSVFPRSYAVAGLTLDRLQIRVQFPCASTRKARVLDYSDSALLRFLRRTRPQYDQRALRSHEAVRLSFSLHRIVLMITPSDDCSRWDSLVFSEHTTGPA